MRGSICLALATTSLLAISNTAARAQGLAPPTLHLTSPDQATKKDVVQTITVTKKAAPAITKKPAQVIAKEKNPEQKTKKNIAQAATEEPEPVITKKSAQVMKKKPMKAIAQNPQTIAKESGVLATEPVRPIEKQSSSETTQPVTHYSYKTPEGKKESAPVITQYYPKRIVYPFAKVDRHIDRKLMYAATIAQERAHAHSRSRCWHYVKEALLASGVINSRPKSELAKEAAQDLVSNYGFKRLSVSDPFAAPIGSVLVYGANRAAGHVEIRTKDGFVSDFCSKTPSPRPLLGVYAKL
jgi:hypothetical protein